MKRIWTIIGVAKVENSLKPVGGFDLEPQLNPATGTREFALRDPDGYYVMISAVD